MNTRRIATAVGVTAGGALAAAFCSAGTAAADGPSDNAIDIYQAGSSAFAQPSLAWLLDPGSDDTINQVPWTSAVNVPGMVTIASAQGILPLEIYDADGTDIGATQATGTMTNWFGTQSLTYNLQGPYIDGNAITAALGNGTTLYGGTASAIAGEVNGSATDYTSGAPLAVIVNGGVQASDIQAASALGTNVDADQATNVAAAMNSYGWVDPTQVNSALSGVSGLEGNDLTDVSNALSGAFQGYALPSGLSQDQLLFDVVQDNLGASGNTDVADILSNAGVTLPSGVTAGDIATALNSADFFSTDNLENALNGYASEVGTGIVNLVSQADLTGGDVTAADLAGLGLPSGTVDEMVTALNDAGLGAGLPDAGTVVTLTDYGWLGETVYIDTPDGAPEEFWTGPFGNTFDVSWLVGNWSALLDPTDILGGDAGGAAADGISGLFDGGLLDGLL